MLNSTTFALSQQVPVDQNSWGALMQTNHSTASSGRLGGRLKENYDGSLTVLPKHPGEIFGTHILRPCIDAICHVGASFYRMASTSLLFAQQASHGLVVGTSNYLPSLPSFPPVANAQETVTLPLKHSCSAEDITEEHLRHVEEKIKGSFIDAQKDWKYMQAALSEW